MWVSRPGLGLETDQDHFFEVLVLVLVSTLLVLVLVLVSASLVLVSVLVSACLVLVLVLVLVSDSLVLITSLCFTGNWPNVVYFNCSLLSVIWQVKYYCWNDCKRPSCRLVCLDLKPESSSTCRSHGLRGRPVLPGEGRRITWSCLSW